MQRDKTFLSVPDFMHETGKSYPSVLRGMKEGRIPFTKLGGRLLIPSSFIDDLEKQAYGAIRGGKDAFPQ